MTMQITANYTDISICLPRSPSVGRLGRILLLPGDPLSFLWLHHKSRPLFLSPLMWHTLNIWSNTKYFSKLILPHLGNLLFPLGLECPGALHWWHCQFYYVCSFISNRSIYSWAEIEPIPFPYNFFATCKSNIGLPQSLLVEILPPNFLCSNTSAILHFSLQG